MDAIFRTRLLLWSRCLRPGTRGENRGSRARKAKGKGRLLFRAFYFVLHKSNRSLPPIDFGTIVCSIEPWWIESANSKAQPLFPRTGHLRFGQLRPLNWIATSEPVEVLASGFSAYQSALTAFTSSSSAPVKMYPSWGFSVRSCLYGGFSFVFIKLFTKAAIPAGHP